MKPVTLLFTLFAVLAPPTFAQEKPAPAKPKPTQSLGAFIQPVAATASSSQSDAGRTPSKMIDGSGFDESVPGSGVYVHTNNVFAAGNCMWNGAPDAILTFDLGKTCRVSGIYLWNYNEGNGYNRRSVREVEIAGSTDNKEFTSLGKFTFAMAPGTEGDTGQAVPFAKPVSARYFRWKILSNYGSGEASGIAELRFANADVKAVATVPAVWKPKYPRPTYPKLKRGAVVDGAENIVFPADAGIVDVTRAPYNAKGDGVTDDTAAIQKAFDDNVDRGAYIYLPNGVYRISDTIRWGGDEGRQRNTVLQGQSRAGTILQLRDRCPGFDNPRKPKGCVYTGHAPAQRFFNEIHNLTVDTGVGNPGACGIQFIANNQGGMYDVAIVSGDGQGVNGLDLGYTNEQGPCLIKNLTVLGFDTGVYSANGVASEVLEHITVERQNKVGFRNDGQPCTLRDLRSFNDVTALRNAAGFLTLTDCVLKSIGKTSTQTAIINDSGLVAFNIEVSGYRIALKDHTGDGLRGFAGDIIFQWFSKPSVTLFDKMEPGPIQRRLSLPIRETPQIPRDALTDWISPLQFGAKPDSDSDASDAIQQAIDSGKPTVYLPRGGYHIGKTIVIRGAVRRLIGLKAYLMPSGELLKQNAPLFRFEGGKAPMVIVEGLITDFSVGPYYFMEHNAKRTLVLHRLGVNFQGLTDAYRTGPNGTGDVYVEDVVGHGFHFRKQTVWARQFNIEGDGTHLSNDGGTLWVLGYKTEGGGTLLETKNGGKTELLGGFSYTVGAIDENPMFVIDNAQASLSFCEVCFTGKPFPIILRETQNGVTKTIPQRDPLWGGHFTLFTSGR